MYNNYYNIIYGQVLGGQVLGGRGVRGGGSGPPMPPPPPSSSSTAKWSTLMHDPAVLWLLLNLTIMAK